MNRRIAANIANLPGPLRRLVVADEETGRKNAKQTEKPQL